MFRPSARRFAAAAAAAQGPSPSSNERLCVPMNNTKVKEHLGILGIDFSEAYATGRYQSRNATTVGAVKAAFRDRCKSSHPDCGGSEQSFREVNEAYNSLMAEHTRNMMSAAANNGAMMAPAATYTFYASSEERDARNGFRPPTPEESDKPNVDPNSTKSNTSYQQPSWAQGANNTASASAYVPPPPAEKMSEDDLNRPSLYSANFERKKKEDDWLPTPGLGIVCLFFLLSARLTMALEAWWVHPKPKHEPPRPKPSKEKPAAREGWVPGSSYGR